MDQFAFHDIPDSIDYILETTKQPSLSYIGFSQGTAQAFATLSIHPTLNDKVDVFIALAPAMSPAGLSNGIVDSLIKASPEVIFLAFGRRSILSSATMWQSLLYPPIFVRIIDMSLSFLFGWNARNISVHQKLAAYPHLYSFTSTKSVVHWFQIIRNKSFQMYDDDVQAPLGIGAGDRYYKVAKFPTRNIKTPIVLIYGGSDSLVDIKVMLKELPRHTVAKEIPHFEHLDFLWAQELDTLVFPHVFKSLEEHAGRDRLKEYHLPYSKLRNGRFPLPRSLNYSEDDVSSPTTDTDVNGTTIRDYGAIFKKKRMDISLIPSPTEPSVPSPRTSPTDPAPYQSSSADTAVESSSTIPWIPRSASRLPKSTTNKHRRNSSFSSSKSLDSNKSARKVSDTGISVGAGKATTLVSMNGH